MWVPDLIIHHHPCQDGFGAALCAYLKFGDRVQFHGAAYGEAPPDVNGQNVLILDFSYPAETLAMMGAAGGAKSIVVLDHHKTAQEALADYITKPTGTWTIGDLNTEDPDKPCIADGGPDGCNILAQFDMERSGARMAWDFLNPGEPAPMMIAMIEDRDLWRFKLPRSKALYTYLRQWPFDFATWANVLEGMADPLLRQRILNEGDAIQRFFEREAELVADQARLLPIAGWTVPVVNCNYAFASEVGHLLLERYPDAPFAATYFDDPDGWRRFSLRSTDDREDVGELAKLYGGGGHRNAAGFQALGGWYLSPPSALTGFAGVKIGEPG